MRPFDVVLVNAGTIFGFLRWAALVLLAILTFYLIGKEKRVGKINLGIVSLIATIILTPFLILDIIILKPVEDDIAVVPDTSDNTTPDSPDQPSVDPGKTSPSSKSSSDVKPDADGEDNLEPEPTPAPEPEPEPDPEYRDISISGATIEAESKDGKYKIGDTIKITADEKEGYTFDKWFSNNDAVKDKTDNPLEFTMPDDNLTIYPTYKVNQYQLTFTKPTDVETDTPSGKYDYGTTITVKAKSKPGYNFMWLSNNADLNEKTDNPLIFTIPASDVSLTVAYSPDDNTPYVVYHKQQNIDNDNYTLKDTDNLSGTTGTEVTPAVKNYEGFISPATQTITIGGDGHTELTYTYNRHSYHVEIGDHISGASTDVYRYGKSFTLTADSKPGYTPKWLSNIDSIDGSTEATVSFTLPDEDVTVTVEYIANTDTPYTVTHNKMSLDGSTYEFSEKDELTGTTDSEITPDTKSYTGFTAPSKQTATISGGGNTNVVYNYARNRYNITIDPQYTSGDTTGEYYFEQPISVTAVGRAGYTFDHWSSDDASIDGKANNPLTFNVSGVVGSLVPVYTPNTDTPYTVYHKQQNVNDDDYTLIETEELIGTTDTDVTPEVKAYTGFTSPAPVEITISGEGDTELTYKYDRNVHTLDIQSSYITGAVSGDYRYEKSFTLTATERAGYTYVWRSNMGGIDGYTGPSFSLLMPDDDLYINIDYIANINTPYQVIHEKQNLAKDAYEEFETDNLTGTTDAEITPEVKNYTGFTAPSTQTVTISGDGSTKVFYKYTRQDRTLTINDSEYVETEQASGSYAYETPITLKAKTRAGYTFTGWSNGETSNPLSFTLTENTTIGPEYNPNTDTPYTVVHMKQNIDDDDYTLADTDNLTGTTDTDVTPDVKIYTGFTAPAVQTVNINGDGSTLVTYNYSRNSYTSDAGDDPYITGDTLSSYRYGKTLTLTATERTGFTHKWVSSVSSINNSTDLTVTFDMPAENITVSLEYTEDEEPIYVCKLAAIETLHTATSGGSPVTYGQVASNPTPQPGDAYDCDVNDDGTYYPTNERFYYLGQSGDNASLIAFSGYDGSDGDEYGWHIKGDTKTHGSYLYADALSRFPTTTIWDNPAIVVQTVDNIDYAARFVTYDELVSACGNNITVTGGLDSCKFIMENSAYDGQGRTGIWLTLYNDEYWRAQTGTGNRKVEKKDNTSKNMGKPVIEVPINMVEILPQKYATISFDSQGGVAVDDISVSIYDPVGDLPETTKDENIFDGWYTDPDHGIKITSDSIIREDIILYAHWIPDIHYNITFDYQDGTDPVVYSKKNNEQLGDLGSRMP